MIRVMWTKFRPDRGMNSKSSVQLTQHTQEALLGLRKAVTIPLAIPYICICTLNGPQYTTALTSKGAGTAHFVIFCTLNTCFIIWANILPPLCCIMEKLIFCLQKWIYVCRNWHHSRQLLPFILVSISYNSFGCTIKTNFEVIFHSFTL